MKCSLESLSAIVILVTALFTELVMIAILEYSLGMGGSELLLSHGIVPPGLVYGVFSTDAVKYIVVGASGGVHIWYYSTIVALKTGVEPVDFTLVAVTNKGVIYPLDVLGYRVRANDTFWILDNGLFSGHKYIHANPKSTIVIEFLSQEIYIDELYACTQAGCIRILDAGSHGIPYAPKLLEAWIVSGSTRSPVATAPILEVHYTQKSMCKRVIGTEYAALYAPACTVCDYEAETYTLVPECDKCRRSYTNSSFGEALVLFPHPSIYDDVIRGHMVLVYYYSTVDGDSWEFSVAPPPSGVGFNTGGSETPLKMPELVSADTYPGICYDQVLIGSVEAVFSKDYYKVYLFTMIDTAGEIEVLYRNETGLWKLARIKCSLAGTQNGIPLVTCSVGVWDDRIRDYRAIAYYSYVVDESSGPQPYDFGLPATPYYVGEVKYGYSIVLNVKLENLGSCRYGMPYPCYTDNPVAPACCNTASGKITCAPTPWNLRNNMRVGIYIELVPS